MTGRAAIRRALGGAAALVGCGLAGPVVAQEIDGDIQVNAGGGYASNPFLFAGDSTGTVTYDAEVRPSLNVSDPRGSINLESYYRRQEYARRYSGLDSYGGSITGSYRLSEVAILTEAIAYQNAVVDLATLFQNGLLDNGGSVSGLPIAGLPIDGPTPGVVTTPLPAGEFTGDASLVGLRQRRSQLNAALTLSVRPNQTDNWQFGLSGRVSRYPGSTAAISYRSLGFLAGYLRSLSQTSTVGISVAAQSITYTGASQASRIYTPELVYSRRFPRNWTVEFGAGASIVDGDKGQAGNALSTAFHVSACHQNTRSNFCLLGTRAANPAGLGRVDVQTTARASYSYKLGDDDTLSADGSYNQVSRAAVAGMSGSQRYYAGNVIWGHYLGRRLQATAQVGYQGRDATNISVSPDVSGRVGVIIRLDNDKTGRRR